MIHEALLDDLLPAGLDSYGWIRHDGASFGRQEIVDGSVTLATSLVVLLQHPLCSCTMSPDWPLVVWCIGKGSLLCGLVVEAPQSRLGLPRTGSSAHSSTAWVSTWSPGHHTFQVGCKETSLAEQARTRFVRHTSARCAGEESRCQRRLRRRLDAAHCNDGAGGRWRRWRGTEAHIAHLLCRRRRCERPATETASAKALHSGQYAALPVQAKQRHPAPGTGNF